jgi:hypothetical protein
VEERSSGSIGGRRKKKDEEDGRRRKKEGERRKGERRERLTKIFEPRENPTPTIVDFGKQDRTCLAT